MGILRRKKIKKHINAITYLSVFSIAAVVITVTAVSGKDNVEYMEFPETETYIVDVVNRDIEKIAMVEAQKETEAVTEGVMETETKDSNESYQGIFMMNTSGSLNVRSRADVSSAVVGVLTEGNGGEVVQYGNEWTKIKYGNVTGYVATEYIVIGEQAKKLLEQNGYTEVK